MELFKAGLFKFSRKLSNAPPPPPPPRPQRISVLQIVNLESKLAFTMKLSRAMPNLKICGVVCSLPHRRF